MTKLLNEQGSLVYLDLSYSTLINFFLTKPFTSEMYLSLCSGELLMSCSLVKSALAHCSSYI